MRRVIEINEGSFGLGELSGYGGYAIVAFLVGLETCEDVVNSIVDLEEGV